MVKFFHIPHTRYFILLLIPFLLECLLLAFNVHDRQDWALENVLVLVALLTLVATFRRFPLSRISYLLIFTFLALHEIGAHYTYARVPYDEWFISLTGSSFNAVVGWERNNFDRIIHFSYGLLIAYPMREVYLRIANAEGFWGYFLPLNFTMSTSMMFELFEWAAAEIFGGELGIAYLGTQGDVWDAHKDMALASLGALIALLVTLAINRSIQRDFAREWASSLKVKRVLPLGEDEIRRLLKDRRNDSKSDIDS
jgi:putative membrane protein